MKPSTSMFFCAGLLALLVTLAALVLVPSQSAYAVEPIKQDPNACLECHGQAGTLWEGSQHRESNISCVVCHKLANTEGKHPESAKYTVETEESTCLVCHAEIAGENIAGDLAISKHGQIGLTCISCHEQHSQGLKLAPGSRTVCENCHKSDMRTVVESTHFAAGLSCVNCHMGEDKNHTLVVSVTTCDKCHTDLHAARRMLDAGLEIEVMDEPDALVEVEPTPEVPTIPESEANAGGISLPSWVYVLAGTLIGGIISWAVLGRDPGISSKSKKS